MNLPVIILLLSLTQTPTLEEYTRDLFSRWIDLQTVVYMWQQGNPDHVECACEACKELMSHGR